MNSTDRLKYFDVIGVNILKGIKVIKSKIQFTCFYFVLQNQLLDTL